MWLTFTSGGNEGESVEASAEVTAVEGEDVRCRIAFTNTGTGEEVATGTARLVPFSSKG